MTNIFFFKCPIGTEICLLLNKVFLCMKYMHLHYEILLRLTLSSPKGEQEREKEHDLKSSKHKEEKKIGE